VIGDDLLRRVLWLTAVANTVVAFVFAFPASLGRPVDLPVPVPTLYSLFVGLFILLFGGAYAWLALQPRINRPLVAFGAVGKTGAVLVVLLAWFLGSASTPLLMLISGDLVLAAIFAAWLLGHPAER
jgi:hypothetical protein